MQLKRTEASFLSRKHYYEFQECEISNPEKASFNKHTMGRNNFLAYIGREYILLPSEENKKNIYDIHVDCKKFSKEQKSFLTQAYRSEKVVKVIGAEKNDLDILLYNNNRKIKANTEPALLSRDNPEKVFNKKRSLMV